MATEKEDLVPYNGTMVHKDWPPQIEATQKKPSLLHNGCIIPRIRYGEEPSDWGADRRPCHDCAAIKGQLHVPGCDVERCPVCYGQHISCGCIQDYSVIGRLGALVQCGLTLEQLEGAANITVVEEE